MNTKARWFWTTFVLWVLIDQITKFWVYFNVEYRVGEIVVIPGAVNVPKADVLAAAESGVWPEALADGRRVVLHCKAGGRSAEALAAVLAAGRPDAVHVAGGVLAWQREIDPALPTY